MKERLRDMLITKTKPSDIKYDREIVLNTVSNNLLEIKDSVVSKGTGISSICVSSKDTHIYVPSSRYYSGTKEPPFQRIFSKPVSSVEVNWKIGGEAANGFIVN
jgi:hypothetical protein